MILSTNSCTFKNGTVQEKIDMMKELGFTGAGADNSPDLAPDAWDGFENIAVHAPFIDLNLISGVKDVRELARQKCL